MLIFYCWFVMLINAFFSSFLFCCFCLLELKLWAELKTKACVYKTRGSITKIPTKAVDEIKASCVK